MSKNNALCSYLTTFGLCFTVSFYELKLLTPCATLLLCQSLVMYLDTRTGITRHKNVSKMM